MTSLRMSKRLRDAEATGDTVTKWLDRTNIGKGGILRTVLTAIFVSVVLAKGQTSNLVWSRPNPSGIVPTPRADAPVAYDSVGRQLAMFGGQDGSSDRNDFWLYSVDRQQWTQVNPAGVSPSPRHGHTATFDPIRRRVIVIAGQGASFFGDVWAYDFRTNSWTQLNADLNGLTPRYGHSAVYDAKRDRIVISHGFTSAGRFDDTWAFDLATNSWR